MMAPGPMHIFYLLGLAAQTVLLLSCGLGCWLVVLSILQAEYRGR